MKPDLLIAEVLGFGLLIVEAPQISKANGLKPTNNPPCRYGQRGVRH